MKTLANIFLTLTTVNLYGVNLTPEEAANANYPVSEQVVSVNANGTIEIPDEIVLNLDELEMIDLIAKSPEQERTKLKISPTACILARMKAEDLVNRAYYGHQDKSGKSVYEYLKDSEKPWVSIAENFVATTSLETYRDLQGYFGTFTIFDENGNIMRDENGQLKEVWTVMPDEPYVTPEVIDRMAASLPMDAVELAYWAFWTSTKGHRTSILGLRSESNMTYVGVGVVNRKEGYSGGIYEDKIVVVTFIQDGYIDLNFRKAYAPDGTDLTNRDAMTMDETAGIRYSSYGTANHWDSSVGRFVNVGGGFLLHDELGMLYHDTASTDYTHSLDVVTQYIPDEDWQMNPVTGAIGNPTAYQTIYDDSTRGVSNQGFNFLHSEYGWIWTHPSIYPKFYKRSGGMLEVIKGVGVKDLTTGVVKNWSRESSKESFVEMNFANWQVYRGDPVVLAWNSAVSPVTVTANANGEVKTSTAGLHAWGWTAEEVGEYPASIVNAKGETKALKLVVIPQPTTANLWIDASSKVVKKGEAFRVSWNALGDVPPQISGTSYGVFSNTTSGSELFARNIAGKYHFTIRMGAYRETVTVEVVE